MNLPDFLNQLRNPNPTSIFHGGNGSYILFENITLTQCQFFQEIKIDHGIIFSNVIFDGVTFNKLITNGFVIFINCKSNEKTFSDFTIESPFNITLKYNFFTEEVIFRNCKCQSFELKGGTFEKQLTFLGAKFNYFEIVGDCDIKNTINFRETDVIELQFKDGNINKVQFESGKINDLILSETVTIRDVIVNGGKYGKIKFDALNIGKVEISNSKMIENELLNIDKVEFRRTGNSFFLFNDGRISNIIFKDSFSSKDSTFNFQFLFLKSLEFNNYVNYGQINLNEVAIINELKFSNSDAGKLSFVACYLEDAELLFFSSKILDSFIIGSKFPKCQSYQKKTDQIELYGQIKKVYENRGSQKDVLEYYSLEMNALDESLSWKKHKWDKLNLWFNKKSTNHGVDWKRGLGSTLCVSALFYFLYVISLGAYGFNPWKLTYWSEFGNILSYFLEFINPTHKTDFIAEKLKVPPTGLSRFIEGLSRIFIAYFIYQLIQAFRKHGKK